MDPYRLVVRKISLLHNGILIVALQKHGFTPLILG